MARVFELVDGGFADQLSELIDFFFNILERDLCGGRPWSAQELVERTYRKNDLLLKNRFFVGYS